MRRMVVAFATSAFLCAICFAQNAQPSAQDQKGTGQDQATEPAPSLGDLARQLKLKKQQKTAKQAASTDAQGSEPAPAGASSKNARLITNDDTPEAASVTPVSTHEAGAGKAEPKSSTGDNQAKAENWKSRIQGQKSAIATLQENIKTLGDSIQYAGANCVANCAQWNERQQQKQQEVDSMKAQLEEAQKALEDMQESARREGFGSSVYDP